MDGTDLNKVEKFIKDVGSSWEAELNIIKELVKDVDKGYKIIYYEMKKKNIGITVLLSFLLPGLGHIYIGCIIRGIIISIVFTVSVFLCLLLIGLLTTPLIWIYSIYDSYRLAKDYNTKLFKILFVDQENSGETGF
ncbi:DUF6677 family protein [Methanofervidicoccus sp. A16]|uniref:DUF6677 family protein n=1 Tax=Methanofervidicoccus sp. A16 TaxID=2607662 RepID=UPI00209C6CC2|nr:DUF6677 family protein [Methanofervidicoccus sp. A16]